MGNETKAVALHDTNLYNEFMRSFDSSGLASAVESLADSNLRDTEKDHAVNILDDWNDNVLSKIRERNQKMRDLIGFFDYKFNFFSVEWYDLPPRIRRSYDDMFDYCPELAEKTDTVELYQKVISRLNDIDELIPSYPVPDYETIKDDRERLEARQRFELAEFEAKEKIEKLITEANRSMREWIKAVNLNSDIKEMLNQARTYSRKVKVFETQCNDLTLSAKSNILLSDAGAREIIKKMINFGKEI